MAVIIMENNYWKDRYFDIFKQCKELRQKVKELSEALNQSTEETKFYKHRSEQLQAELSTYNSEATDIPLLSMNSICGLKGQVQRSMSRRFTMKKAAHLHLHMKKDEDLPIFEQFLILGPSEVSDFSARTLYQFPEHARLNPSVLADFAFPDGLKPTTIDMSDSGSALYHLVYANYERDGNSFIFTVKSTEEHRKSPLEIANKDRELLYCCCVVTYEVADAFELVDCPLLPRCYCIVSYYPCFELHFEVLFRILSIKKIQRLSDLSPDTHREIARSDTIRTAASYSEIDTEELSLLKAYHSIKGIPRKKTTLSLVSVPNIDIDIPNPALMDYEWVCPTLFSLLEFEDFFQLICAVAHEKTIVFISENLDHITSCVLGMIALLRPFSWPHLICPLLPESLKELLDAPVPLVGGVIRPANEMSPDIITAFLDTRQVTKSKEVEPCSIFKTQVADLYCEFTENPNKATLYNIVHTFRNYWMDLVSKVPTPTELFQAFDMAEVRMKVIENTHESDREFVRKIIETQYFINAVEGIYNNF